MNRIHCTGNSAALESWVGANGGTIGNTSRLARRTVLEVEGLDEKALQGYCSTHPEVSFEPAIPPAQVAGKTLREIAADLRKSRKETLPE